MARTIGYRTQVRTATGNILGWTAEARRRWAGRLATTIHDPHTPPGNHGSQRRRRRPDELPENDPDALDELVRLAELIAEQARLIADSARRRAAMLYGHHTDANHTDTDGDGDERHPIRVAWHNDSYYESRFTVAELAELLDMTPDQLDHATGDELQAAAEPSQALHDRLGEIEADQAHYHADRDGLRLHVPCRLPGCNRRRTADSPYCRADRDQIAAEATAEATDPRAEPGG